MVDLLFSFGLVSPVLEPDFHLGLGQSQAAGQVRSLRSGQVFLLVKCLLQFEHLQVRKGCARAFLFPRRRE